MESTVVQEYATYTDADHETWATLSKRQETLSVGKISSEYLLGVERLQFDAERIVNIEELSNRLALISGWTLIPVTGLIPTKEFFYMLINKRYPVTVSIRRPWEIDFSENPDIFHDVCGHLPLITNEKFVKFLTAYSVLALKYINNERAIELLGRLYWFTYEMGIIYEQGEYKPYGGAIITSLTEINNMANNSVPKHSFDIDHVFRTPYNPFKLQKEYFVINSFDELFSSLETLESKLIEQLLLPQSDSTIRNYNLNSFIGKQFNNVIGFLNDIQYRFPNAVSFVAGQPDESFFNVRDCIAKADVYFDYACKMQKQSKEYVIGKVGQYSKTKGIINEIVAEYLLKDENISISPDHILMTVGAQEAFAIIVATICNRDKGDVILVEDPSYIGLSSFAKVFDYSLCGVAIDDEGVDLKALKNKIIEVNGTGKRIKLLYVIPDFQNPTGSSMPIGNRLKLLELAYQYNFLIIEDSVYNSFTYEQKRRPTLKSLDRYNRVIYVGSFSKSVFPGLRIGLIAASQLIEDDRGGISALVDEMVKVKAQLTNNTSTISQAILGGILLDFNYSLSDWSNPKYNSYRHKRDCMVRAMNKYIKSNEEGWAKGIRWKEPDGGFFIKVELPFALNENDVLESVTNFNVIFCPMRFFYLNGGGEREIRLTFSNLSPEHIEMGIRRLAGYLESKATTQKPAVGSEIHSN